MKNAIIILVILCCLCFCLAYRLGVSNCRTSVAETTTRETKEYQAKVERITKSVMRVPADDNLRWLLTNYKRAD